MQTVETDVLVIGSGLAGLTTALNISPKKNIILTTKIKLRGSNTYYAQGGVAVVLNDVDDLQNHFEDTIKAGAGLCDENATRTLVEDGPQRINEIIKLGVNFDKMTNNKYEFLKEGAHSKRRVMHVADRTGFSIENVLVRQIVNRKNINIKEKMFIKKLLVVNQNCYGAVFINEQSGKEECIIAKKVVLATGGAGNVFDKNTNWKGSTGDGLVAAYEAGAIIRDMEFYQFHPTAIQLRKKKRGIKNFLISESVRGEGAIVVDEKGQRFLYKYDERGELAPRDVVARAIFSQIKAGKEVFLDLTKMNCDLKKKFPVIYKNCLKDGYDIAKKPIPIVPVAHYMMGGIQTDTQGRTNIHNLYACGEVSSTGVHGANRLASNSLLECVVFGYRVAQDINKSASESMVFEKTESSARKLKKISAHKIMEIRENLQKLMYDNVGIERTGQELQSMLVFIKENLDILRNSKATNFFTHMETKNLLVVAYLITSAAIQRQESRGAHFRLDFPQTNKSLDGVHTFLEKSQDQ